MGTTQGARITPKSIKAGDVSDAANLTREMMEQNTDIFPQSIEGWRKFDDVSATLPNAATGSHLGLIAGTFGTAASEVRTSDSKNTTVTQKARRTDKMPQHFVEGTATSRYRVHVGMMTTVASSSATVDVSIYKVDDDGTVGSDLVSTSAQSINSLTDADKDFSFDSSALSPGDVLDIQVTIAITDSATGTAVIGLLRKSAIVCTVQP
jgi:hypothetical protein